MNLGIFPDMPNKIEGTALVRKDILVIANDNDFGMVDNATFDSRGRLSNDTLVKSKLFFIQLAAPVN